MFHRNPRSSQPRQPSALGQMVVLVAVTAWSLSAVPSLHAQSPTYILRDLGVLSGHTSSVAWAINASGEVVGWSGSSPTRAFLYRDGVGMVELPGLQGHTRTLARGISDGGVVVGGGWGTGIPEHALRWTGGLVEDLGVLDGTSEGWDINEAGVTVGSSGTHAFLHTDAGGMVEIHPDAASAHDVNEAGQITGSASLGAFLWSPGPGFQPLGTLDDYPFSHGRAVNISSQVAGFAISATGNRERLFRHTPGLGLVELGGVGETNRAWGMNARGSVVGEGRPSSGPVRAFVYTVEGGLQALNNLIDASPQWFLLLATDINDAGQIVGYGFDNATAQTRAFRLDPVTAVGPLAHLALNPVQVVGGALATGWVTLTDPAPQGGASVTLASDVPTLVAIPPSVLVSQGERHASFPVATMNPTSLSSVRLSASYGGTNRSAWLAIEPAEVTGVVPGRARVGLRVMPPYPNPAVAEARIFLELAQGCDVGVRVHDVRGRLVKEFQFRDRPSGSSELVWDLRDASGAHVTPGVYHLELNARGQRATARIVVLPH